MTLRAKFIIVTLFALLLSAATVSAQDGQFCARAYEDRNGNGVRDTSDPPLTRGIGATLQDARGVVVATAMLDNSPTAGSGVICFQGLNYTQYTLTITSAEFTATTGDSLIAELVRGQTPPVLEYGGQRVTVETAAPVVDDAPAFDRDELAERALVSALGSGVAMLITAIFGVIVYLLFVRPRIRRAAAAMSQQQDYEAQFRRPDPRQTATQEIHRQG